MRRMTAVLTVVAAALMGTGVVALTTPSVVLQAKPSFAGEWKMLGGPRGEGGAGPDLIITQSDTLMTVEDMRARQAPTPVKLSYKLDGSASTHMMAGRAGGSPTEQISKAMWAGNSVVVATTTVAGEEKRTFSTDGAYLVIEMSAPARNGGPPNVTKVTYQRYVRGFGG